MKPLFFYLKFKKMSRKPLVKATPEECRISLVQATPEELKTLINETVKPLIDDIKDSLKPKEPTKYLTRQEVADLLQINLTTLHNYVKQGKLVSYSLGRRVYFKRYEVENAIVKLQK